jgi:hypothetical protein
MFSVIGTFVTPAWSDQSFETASPVHATASRQGLAGSNGLSPPQSDPRYLAVMVMLDLRTCSPIFEIEVDLTT